MYLHLFTSAIILLIIIDSILGPTGLFLNYQPISDHSWCPWWLRLCYKSQSFQQKEGGKEELRKIDSLGIGLNQKDTIQKCITLLSKISIQQNQGAYLHREEVREGHNSIDQGHFSSA